MLSRPWKQEPGKAQSHARASNTFTINHLIGKEAGGGDWVEGRAEGGWRGKKYGGNSDCLILK